MAYSILFKQCGSDHMTRGRSRAIDRIVVHFTATLASARNNATCFARNEGQGASAHYFVDDITPEIYQSVAEGDTAWHAGDWQMSCRAIGTEVVSAGEDFSATEVEKLGWLVKKLMARYGIGASGVIRHYDVTGKLCPAPYVAASKWAALKAAITGGAAHGPGEPLRRCAGGGEPHPGRGLRRGRGTGAGF
ncbi:MAG: N-acetylmuramoyl-L-alanine amidase [Parolsenella sp.]|uniref:peptidoglycan recognition protein family protein n=1 Tax=Parolsenella sp. TaxID=2083006 RepID=UPI002A74860E|nr:N-acetylmuramoyl-L-alanine amidase [Parolsenella sp.]MDY3291578.1 N-acetylmuramoyl-L-alanine amidase [Parolsenella sp.]